MNARKGRSKNKKQRDAADAAAAAAELAELLRKRKRSGGSTDDSSPKRHKHVPQKVGRGGVREKLDVEQLDSPSRKAVLQLRERVAHHRLTTASPFDEYDMIQELMPEPMGGEYM